MDLSYNKYCINTNLFKIILFAGWFTQCDEGPGGSKREYCYAYSTQSSHYVEWHERQHRTIKEGKLEEISHYRESIRKNI